MGVKWPTAGLAVNSLWAGKYMNGEEQKEERVIDGDDDDDDEIAFDDEFKDALKEMETGTLDVDVEGKGKDLNWEIEVEKALADAQ